MPRPTAKATHLADAEIFIAARRALDRRGAVPEGVHAHVDGGVVTLTGTVRWRAERAEAEDAVRPIAGVQRVVNYITATQLPNGEGLEPADDAG